MGNQAEEDALKFTFALSEKLVVVFKSVSIECLATLVFLITHNSWSVTLVSYTNKSNWILQAAAESLKQYTYYSMIKTALFTY